MFNTFEKTSRYIVFTLISLILVSCGSEATKTGVDRPQKGKGIPVRYLEEIACNASNYNCYKEEVVKRIKELCIENGFTRERPVVGVIYSRSTAVPVKGTAELIEKKMESIQATDPSGIVTSEEVMKEYAVTEYVSGYCIGTEYIVSM